MAETDSSSNAAHAASFRDRDGFVFRRGGRVLRQVNRSYQATYEQLVTSGLFARLWKIGVLIAHEESSVAPVADGFKVLDPEQLLTLTYPYEWCFGQLKDAALLTLRVQREAMKLGFSLKDASAYNVQFLRGRAVFIDTLSFEPYVEGRPWAAYRQFCQHFLAPLALMARVDARMGTLLRNYIDGIPLDLASRVLRWRSRLNFGLLVHIHLHAKAQRRYLNRERKMKARPVSRQGVLGILGNLESTVRGLDWKPAGTEWGDYYTNTNYADPAREDKTRTVDAWIEEVRPSQVWDLGANDGTFSRLASQRGIPTVAWDIDPAAVEAGYRRMKREKETNLLPALVDLANPSPALGWNLEERGSLFDRPRPDLVLALALIHHLAIGNNVPLVRCAAFFARVAPNLIIEWVPKEDSKVQELLQNREDVFGDYTQVGFERAFGGHFRVEQQHSIHSSKRILYYMKSSLAHPRGQ